MAQTTRGRQAPIPRALQIFEKPIVPIMLFLLPILFAPRSLSQIELIWDTNSRAQSLATSAAIYAIVAYGLGTLMRFAGLPSVVHGALWGTGAYTAGIVARDWGWTYWQALPMVIIVPSILALIVGFMALRTHGIAFIIITIALGDFLVLVANNDPLGTQADPFTGGAFGLVAKGRPESIGPFDFQSAENMYYLALAFLFITIGIVYLISKSAFGRRLEAIRDNEDLAKSLGLNAFLYKILIFTITAAIVGVAGQLFLYHTRAIQPSLFNTFSFIQVLLMVVMGGMGVLAGPAVGAWLVTFLPEWLGPLGLEDPNRQLIARGILLMAFMLLAPMGLVGTIKAWYLQLRNMYLRRQGLQPAVVAPETVGVPTFGTAVVESTDGAEAAAVAAAASEAHASAASLRASVPRPTQFGEPLLTASGVSKSFAAVLALRGVDISVRQGEILGIIGPNGSGKTTLFNCISGFLPLTEGTITWRGTDITSWPPDRVARHGLVRTFQQAMLFRSTTVRRSIQIARESLDAIGVRETAKLDFPDNVAGILDFCDLTPVADQPAAMLPYGVIRKLGVALALSTHPHLLMLDEPAAGLNDIESEELGTLLLRARAAGVTLVVVDHDMPFLMPISDRLLVLDAGQKIVEGSPEQIQSDQRVIAAYLGERFAKMAAENMRQQAGDR